MKVGFNQYECLFASLLKVYSQIFLVIVVKHVKALMEAQQEAVGVGG